MGKIRAWRFFSAGMALVLVLQLGFLADLPVPTVAADPVVTFPDTNLQAAIRLAISKPTGDIHASELAGLTTLDANSQGIINLTGLEYCTNLTHLYLQSNQISNLAPLAGLASLIYLVLQSNQISNLVPLAGLTNLYSLLLDNNQISNLTPLAGLTNLKGLGLDNNQISNLTPLAGLINLQLILLNRNQISDIATLISITGLAPGIGVDLRNNPLSPTSINVHIPALQAKGVTVLYDAAWPMFGHDLQHTGRSPYLGPQTNTIKWAYSTGSSIYCSPAINSDGTIYFGTGDGKVYAINHEGTLKWSYSTGDGFEFSSPAIDRDGTIYIGSGFIRSGNSDGGRFYAINPNGTLKWSYETGRYIQSSPAIGSDGTVYFCSEDCNLYALNPDGTLKWSCAGPMEASPSIENDGMIYVNSPYGPDNRLYAVNPDGTLKWSYSCSPGGLYNSSSIGSDGTVYFAVGHEFYAMNPNGTLKWSYTDDILQNYSQLLSAVVVGSDGTVYSKTAYKQELYAINPNGSLKWHFYMGEGYNIRSSSPTIGGDGTIYVGSDDHNIYAVNPNGTLKWSYLTEGVVLGTPAIGSDGTLYVGSPDGKLYAFRGPSVISIASINPDSGNQGQTLAGVIINGTNFTGATAVSFGTGITVNSFTINSDTEITASISIAGSANIGPSDVSVTTPNGIGTKNNGFRVNATTPLTVSTSSATNITATSATLNGNLSLGTFDNATVSFQKGSFPGIYSDNTTPQIKTAPGTFSYNMTGLTPATTYYYRARSTSDNFTFIYGTELNFTTSGVPGQITTTTGTGTLTLISNLGNITSLSAISIQTLPNWPPLIIFPHGLMYFEVSNIAPGSMVTFTITFPIALPANIQYWKYQPTHGWFQIPIASHNGNVITIQITDGGLGDADGLANGIIIDPGGVAVPATPTPIPTPLQTPANPLIGTNAPTSHGSSMVGTTITTQPVQLTNIQIQSASLSASKVAPGTPITVTANIANRGTVNGSMKIKLYINGEEDSSQSVTVESVGNRPVYFTVSRSQPGTYAVYVGGMQAGSFMVDDAIEPNVVLFISCALIAFSLILGIVYILRRRDYGY